MKTRESGMPPEEVWHSFFDPAAILRKLELTPNCRTVVDFGCGYGTFTIPAAEMTKGIVLAIDIDPEMAALTRAKAAGLPSVHVEQRDFVASGCGLPAGVADYVMLFNILHAAEAESLLRESMRVLRPRGTLAVLHWNYDESTPRGPSMGIRLRPDQCRQMVEATGFTCGELINLPPFHYGFVARPS